MAYRARGIGKKRMTSCNEMYRGSKQPFHKRLIKNCRVVSHCMNGGKPVNVSNSITHSKGERLTDKRPKPQWTNVNWDEAEKHVNTLANPNCKSS